MSEIEAQQLAYRMMGSSPCEDCKKYRHCHCSGNVCEAMREFQKEYNCLVKSYIKNEN